VSRPADTLGARIAALATELAARPLEVLEESPEGRAVVAFERGGVRLVAKFASSMDAAHGHELLAALHEALQASSARTLRVPESLGWFAGPRAQVGAAAEGTACRALAPRGAEAVFTRIGRALAELHALAPLTDLPPRVALRLGPPRRLRDHLAELVRPAPAELAAHLAARCPEDAQVVEGNLARLFAEEARLGPVAPVLLHRDFHLRQLFDDGRCVTVVDWDDAALGDPAFDVAYFTTYLATHLDAEQAAIGGAAFRAGYGGDAHLWARTATWARFNWLRRACRRLRLGDTGWERELAAMVARLRG
jgi:aminoglycoside phosphotransferase (APT) family kinase protein